MAMPKGFKKGKEWVPPRKILKGGKVIKRKGYWRKRSN